MNHRRESSSIDFAQEAGKIDVKNFCIQLITTCLLRSFASSAVQNVVFCELSYPIYVVDDSSARNSDRTQRYRCYPFERRRFIRYRPEDRG